LGVVAAIGGGLDGARVSPIVTDSLSVSLRGDRTYSTPALRVEAGFELALGTFRAAVGTRVDISLSDTHYDVMRGWQAERVATPWPVIPGLVALGAWQGS
jgi:hypothetical protein